ERSQVGEVDRAGGAPRAVAAQLAAYRCGGGVRAGWGDRRGECWYAEDGEIDRPRTGPGRQPVSRPRPAWIGRAIAGRGHDAIVPGRLSFDAAGRLGYSPLRPGHRSGNADVAQL